MDRLRIREVGVRPWWWSHMHSRIEWIHPNSTKPHANECHHLTCQIHNSLPSYLSFPLLRWANWSVPSFLTERLLVWIKAHIVTSPPNLLLPKQENMHKNLRKDCSFWAFSFKVSVCSLMIKELCRSRAGWNDRAPLLKQNLEPWVRIRSSRFLILSDLWTKQCQKALPSALSKTPSSLCSQEV